MTALVPLPRRFEHPVPARPSRRAVEAGRLIDSLGLAGVVRTASEHSVPGAAPAQPVLSVVAELLDLLPARGIAPGTTLTVTGSIRLLILLIAEASAAGAFCAIVGLPGFGALAAHEAGVSLERLALVPDPGTRFAEVLAGLMDGFDIVVAGDSCVVTPSVAGKLMTRARERNCVLVTVGSGWPGAGLALVATDRRWTGLGQGRGRLKECAATVTVSGRGAAVRPRSARVLLTDPGASGERHAPAAGSGWGEVPRARAG